MTCRPTQELRGLGLANIVGSMFNCYTTTGSFSRSSVMDMVGSKTQLAGIVSGLCVMIVLLCLTPVFKNMPQNAQAAIIISAVSGLFNYEEWIFLFKVRFDRDTSQVLLCDLASTLTQQIHFFNRCIVAMIVVIVCNRTVVLNPHFLTIKTI